MRSTNLFFLSAFICVHLWLILLSSCSTKPTDLRSLVPAETLIYLETNDLAAALQPIIDNESFKAVAKSQPDISALKGIQLAVSVSGFEMTEEKLTDEHSVGRVQPRFVAIAETHAWNWQAVAFAENSVGAFVMDIYRSDVSQDRTDKNGGTWFTWKANDGRKAFAFVTGSLIYFGNDESAIEKCLAVRRGETDSMAKTAWFQPVDPGALAAGYMSPDGVAQIANIVGLTLAVKASDDSEVQSFISSMLPEVIRNSVKGLQWISKGTERGIEDRYYVALDPDLTYLYKTKIQTTSQQHGFEEFVPNDFFSTTRYSIKDPQIVLPSILLSLQSKTNSSSGLFIVALSNSLFEPYAIENGELFLSSIEGQLTTVRLDADGDDSAVIAQAMDLIQLKRSISSNINLSKASEKNGDAEVWKSDDGEIAVAVIGSVVVLGDARTVLKCLAAKQSAQNSAGIDTRTYEWPDVATFTVTNEIDPTAAVAETLGDRRLDHGPFTQRSFTSTSFGGKEMQRTTISDIGLIGTILANLASEK